MECRQTDLCHNYVVLIIRASTSNLQPWTGFVHYPHLISCFNQHYIAQHNFSPTRSVTCFNQCKGNPKWWKRLLLVAVKSEYSIIMHSVAILIFTHSYHWKPAACRLALDAILVFLLWDSAQQKEHKQWSLANLALDNENETGFSMVFPYELILWIW